MQEQQQTALALHHSVEAKEIAVTHAAHLTVPEIEQI